MSWLNRISLKRFFKRKPKVVKEQLSSVANVLDQAGIGVDKSARTGIGVDKPAKTGSEKKRGRSKKIVKKKHGRTKKTDKKQ